MISGHGRYRLARAGIILSEGYYKNTISDEAKVAMVAAVFNGERLGANWYYGLFVFTGLAGTALGSMAAHPAWTEVTCGPATRTLWSTTRTLQTSIDLTEVSYHVDEVAIEMTDTGQVQGIFSTNKEAIGDDSGILWSLAQITLPEVSAGDILTITYSMSLSRGDGSLTQKGTL